MLPSPAWNVPAQPIVALPVPERWESQELVERVRAESAPERPERWGAAVRAERPGPVEQFLQAGQARQPAVVEQPAAGWAVVFACYVSNQA